MLATISYNCYTQLWFSLKNKRPVVRRRKVIKQRRRPGYGGGQRRVARKANSDENPPFTPKFKQEHIKGTYFHGTFRKVVLG